MATLEFFCWSWCSRATHAPSNLQAGKAGYGVPARPRPARPTMQKSADAEASATRQHRVRRRSAPGRVDLGAYRIADPEAFGRNVLRLMEEGQKVLNGFLERARGATGAYTAASEWTEAAKLFSEITQPWMAEPAKAGRGAGGAVQPVHAAHGAHRRARHGRGGAAGGRAGAGRQPLQRPGVEPQPLLRLLEAGLSHHGALARGACWTRPRVSTSARASGRTST